MDEIELKVHDMSSTLQPADAYALVLEEVNGNRKLPIIIGSLEAQAIKVVMMGYKMPRPLTHDLFLTVTKELWTISPSPISTRRSEERRVGRECRL